MDIFLFKFLIYFPIAYLLNLIFNHFKRTRKSSKDIYKCNFDTDILIIGGGVVGIISAITFARQGKKIIVIEKDLVETNRLVGELLQPGGVKLLASLEITSALENIDSQKKLGYVIHNKSDNTVLTYEDSYAMAFHYSKFVSKLRNIAYQEKNIKFIEAEAKELIWNQNFVIGVKYQFRTAWNSFEHVFAPLTIIADGIFSNFRYQLGYAKPNVVSHYVGLLLEDCPEFKKGYSEVIFANPCPILCYKISSKETRVLVNIKGKLPKDLKGYLSNEICHQLPKHIQTSFLNALSSDEIIKSMPSSDFSAKISEFCGYLIIGDALNIRNPLTGAGISVLLNDVHIISKRLANINDLSNYEQIRHSLKSFRIFRKSSHAFTINVLAHALYELFSSGNDPVLCQMRTACFDYFKRVVLVHQDQWHCYPAQIQIHYF